MACPGSCAISGTVSVVRELLSVNLPRLQISPPLPGSRDYDGVEEELLPEAKSIISRKMARGVLS